MLCSRCRRRCRRTVATARVYSLGYSIVSRISCVSRHVDVKCNYRSGICPVCSNVSLLCCSVSIAMQGLLKCSWTKRKLQSCLKLRNSQNSFCHTLNKNYEKNVMICSFSSDLLCLKVYYLYHSSKNTSSRPPLGMGSEYISVQSFSGS